MKSLILLAILLASCGDDSGQFVVNRPEFGGDDFLSHGLVIRGKIVDDAIETVGGFVHDGKIGFAAITLYPFVVVRSEVFNLPHCDRLALFAHEEHHFLSQKKTGVTKWTLSYVLDWIRGLIDGGTVAAYSQLGAEAAARDAAEEAQRGCEQ